MRNSHRGVLHADREDRPLWRAPQGVRQVGPLRRSHEAQDMRSHSSDSAASLQHQYVLMCQFVLTYVIIISAFTEKAARSLYVSKSRMSCSHTSYHFKFHAIILKS